LEGFARLSPGAGINARRTFQIADHHANDWAGFAPDIPAAGILGIDAERKIDVVPVLYRVRQT
jgi:hypothetical protein